ncbi:MAG TPA: chemotaxis response regulator protein-glutamate methylesterase, partial [Thermoanaerobaculia bacterium]
ELTGMIHVLIVDDSSVVRMTLGSILISALDFTLDTASDPIIAMRKIARRRPDVIILDLDMPHMDGLTFLRQLMSTDPIPVVICSGMEDRESELGICALEEGAIDIISKPQLGVRDVAEHSSQTIIEIVRSAAGAQLRRSVAPIPFYRAWAPRGARQVRFTTDKIVAVAASTGGTEAIRRLLLGMTPDCPGMVIVQHLPAALTTAFASRLHEICRIEVREAQPGDKLTPGRALIAPGNRHTIVRKRGAHYVVDVCDTPVVNHHRPSADVLFRSVAQAAGPNAVGVILTGMGNDGAAGLREMRQQGAATIAQDEASCVVFGMPMNAIECGAVEDVLPLDEIADAVLRSACADRMALRQ